MTYMLDLTGVCNHIAMLKRYMRHLVSQLITLEKLKSSILFQMAETLMLQVRTNIVMLKARLITNYTKVSNNRSTPF